MEYKYIKNPAKLIAHTEKFIEYVKANSQTDSDIISFDSPLSILGREEGYKAGAVSLESKKILRTENWDKNISQGKIFDRIAETFNIKIANDYENNLVNWRQKDHFKKCCEENPSQCERALYYHFTCKTEDEEKSMEQLIGVFGKKYGLIAYLFFLKDSAKYLPCSPSNFEGAFDFFDCDYKMSQKLSWSNYLGFIDIVKEVRDFIEPLLPLGGACLRLIDSHSFLWILNEDKYRNWIPDQETASRIEERTEADLTDYSPLGRNRSFVSIGAYKRSKDVVEITKRRAGGICQLCNNPAPFIDSNGTPYLECHHVVWLSRGGRDDINNTVSLCPNCHKKMHRVDDELDIRKLNLVIESFK